MNTTYTKGRGSKSPATVSSACNTKYHKSMIMNMSTSGLKARYSDALPLLWKGKAIKSLATLFVALFAILGGDLFGQRVENGLVSLYDFHEGSGTVIHDVSNVGTPADLHLSGSYSWNADGGVQFSGGIAESSGAVSKVDGQISNGDDLTVELWFRSDNTNQTGPARLFTYSSNTVERNFTVGQNGNKLDFRLRHMSSSNNGLPSNEANYNLDYNLHHFVASVQSDGAIKFYVDGNLVDTDYLSSIPNLSNWDDSFKLALGNEMTDNRAWHGDIMLAAIYNRDLNASEVLTNYNAGLNPCTTCTANPVSAGGWDYSCAEGVQVELYSEGIKDDVPATLNFGSSSQITQVVAEVVYKGCNPGASIDISAGGDTYSAPRTTPVGGSSNVFVYRTTIPAVSSITYSNQSNESCAQSLVAYVFRENNFGGATTGHFTNQSGYNNIENVSIPIPTDVAPREIHLEIPISELTPDNRYIHISANAGGVTESFYDQINDADFDNGCCVKIFDLTLSNVPGNASTVDLTIDTRNNGPLSQGKSGQSYVLAGAVNTEVLCICSNVTDAGSIGPDSQDACAGSAVTINSVSLPTGGSGTLEYTWLFNASQASENGATPINTNAATLTVSPSESGWYQRRARRNECLDYTGESNWVYINVGDCLAPPSDPSCSGSELIWQNNIDVTTLTGSYGIPQADLRMIDGGVTSFCIPGPYPDEFDGPVTLSIDEAVSYDAYTYRVNVSQSQEKWKVVFKKNGNVEYQSMYTGDVQDNISSGEWIGALDQNIFLPNGTDEICIIHIEDPVLGDGSIHSSANSVVPSSLCISVESTCDNVTNPGEITPGETVCAGESITISNVELPTGGTGGLEFIWVFNANAPDWTGAISIDSNTASLTLSPTESGYYRRCARRIGCTDYIGETDWIYIEVEEDCCELNVDLGPDQIACAEDVILSPIVDGLTDCSNDCNYVVTAPNRCLEQGDFYVFHIQGAPGGSQFSSDDATFTVNNNGTARFQATASNGTDNLTIDIIYSDFTTTTPADSPKMNVCEDTNTNGWIYYQTTNGTVISQNHGTYTVSRNGESFQLGNSAMHIAPGFGASGWIQLSGGDGTYQFGDVNIALSNTCQSLIEYSGDCDDPSDCLVSTSNASTVNYISGVCPTNGPNPYASCANNIICIASMHNDWDLSFNATDETTVYGISADFWYPTDGSNQGGIGNLPSCPTSYDYNVIFKLNGTILETISGNVPENAILTQDIIMSTPAIMNAGDNFEIIIDGLPSGADCDLFELAGLRVEGHAGAPVQTAEVSYAWSTGETSQSITVSESGEYIVTVTDCSGCVSSDTINVSIGELQTIGNFVWVDANANGCQDPNEEGFEGATLTLYECATDGNGNPTTAGGIEIAMTSSDANGFYQFEDCFDPSKSYYINISQVPTTYELSPADNCGSDSQDSDADENGNTTCFNIPSNGNQPDVDFGLYTCQDIIATNEPVDLTLDCDVAIPDPIDPGFTDGTSSVITVTFSENEAPQTCGTEITRTWTATSECGESLTVDQVITVIDNEAPVITFTPEDVTISCNDPLPSLSFQFQDNCDNLLDIVMDTQTLDLPCGGIQYTFTQTATDDCGNSVSGSAIVTRTDENQPTVISGPADLNLTCDDIVPDSVEPTFEDTCDDQLTITFNESSNTNPNAVTTITRTWTATDDCGNSVDYTQLITITPCAVNVGNYVWYDDDQDGIQDANENPVEGVTVNLISAGPDGIFHTADDLVTDSQVTDENGLYLFTDVDPGTYCIEFIESTIPTDFIFTAQDQGGDNTLDSDVNSEGKTTSFTVTPGQADDLTWDAGIYDPIDPANIGNYVWEDTNQDGIQDPNEAPVQGVTVVLYGPGPDGIFHTADDEIIDTDTTDADGLYLFEDVDPGTYCIEFVEATLPGDYQFTAQDQGGDNTQDSDVDQEGKTTSFTVTNGQDDDLTWDAGIYSPINVGDFVWYDTDQDGVQDSNENPVSGVTVTLYGPGPDGLFHTADDVTFDTQVTDSNGEYLFEDVAPGTYCIEFVESTLPDNYIYTAQDQGGNDQTDSDVNENGKTTSFTVTGGQYDDLTWDAGIYKPITIGDYVWIDTDQDGVQDPNESPVEGVTVNLIGPGPDGLFHTADDEVVDTQMTDSDGEYLFENVEPGTYCIEFVEGSIPAGFEFTEADQGGNDDLDSDVDELGKTDAFTVVGDQDDDLSFDAGIYEPINVGDYVWIDTNQDGIQDPDELPAQGVTVVLNGPGPDGLFHTADDEILDTQVTDENGEYLFEDVQPGTYCIEFISSTLPSGYLFTEADQGGDDENDSDASEDGKTQPFTVTGGQDDDLSHDAGIYEPISVGDFVWYDTDQDGIQDPSEEGVEDVTVNLIGPGPDGLFHTADDEIVDTQITDEDGEYLFEDVAPGIYCIEFVEASIPADFVFTTPDASGNNAVESDADETGKTGAFTVVAGQDDDLTWDAGIYKPISIGDFVWFDNDFDGIQDPDEPGTPGVAVNLIGPGPDGLFHTADDEVVDTQITDANGEYLFEDVAPGTYCIEFVDSTLPADYEFTTQNQGGDDTQDSDTDSDGKTTSFTISGDQDDDLTWDAGIYSPVSVGNYVWFDDNQNGIQDSGENPVEGVTIQLYGPGPDGLFHTADDVLVDTQTTDANGEYLFEDVDPGTYCIQFVETTLPNDYFFTSGNQGGNDALDSDVDGTGKTGAFSLVSGQDDDLTWDAGITTCSDIAVDPIPAPINLECDETVPAPVEPNFMDPYDANLTITYSEVTNNITCGYEIIRTWTATNYCGNSMTVNQVVTVTDTQAPVITFAPQDITISCDEPLPSLSFQFEDNCDNQLDISMTSQSVVLNDCGDIEYTFTQTATDDCGLSVSGSVKVTVVDDEAPVLFAPANLEADISCEDCDYPTALEYMAGTLTAIEAQAFETNIGLLFEQADIIPTGVEDNCDEDVEWTQLPLEVDFNVSCPLKAKLICQFVAIDECGNVSDTLVTALNIIDYDAPVLFDVPDDISMSCGAVPAPANVTAADDCSSVQEVVYTENIISESCPVTIIRTWTATDGCGNVTSASQNISISDTEAPVLSGVPANVSGTCPDVQSPAVVTATDNCGPVDVIYSEIDQSVGCNINITRTWTATDVCGNSTSESQTITFNDDEAPVLSGVPANINGQCGPIPAIANVQASDNCSDVQAVFSENDQSTGCITNIVRTWTATDDCGNTTSQSQTIYYEDTTPPQIIAPADATMDCAGGDYSPANTGLASAIDNCDDEVEINFSDGPISGSCPAVFTRTWTAIDGCGNTATHDQTITIVDETAPVITAPGNTTIDCNAASDIAALGNATGTDACGEVSISHVDGPLSGNCPYTFTRTFTATDLCGNTSTADQVITIEDTEAPTVVSSPIDSNGDCSNGNLPAEAPVFNDNCDNNLNVSYAEVSNDLACGYEIIRTWTATDACGNSTASSQTVTFTDAINPAFSNAPGNITVQCNAIPNAPQVSATDNCDNDVTVTYNGETATSGCPYTITRSWTATDDCGNTVDHTQIITVEDNSSPILNGVPANINAQCGAIPSAPNVTATDNCDSNVVVEMSEQTMSNACPQIIVRTWTATDACGNIATAQQTITYDDTQAPIITGPADTTIDCADPNSDAAITGLASAIDNCDDEVEITFADGPISGSCPQSFVRTFTAIDGCGNIATAQQTISIVDETAPELDVPADISIECTESTLPAVTGEANATDACSAATINYTDGNLTGACPASFVRTWTAVDACGNETSDTQVITITDTEAPVLSNAPEDTSVSCEASLPSDEPSFSDACDTAPQVQMNEVSNDLPCGYEIIRTWTATDACGNAASHSQTITVIDTQAPTFVNAPTNVTVECVSIPSVPNVSASDNCDSNASVAYQGQTMTQGCPFTITRTWIATDECGNTATHTQVITVEDTVAPQLINVPTDVSVDCESIPAMAIVSSVDNCDDDVQLTSSEVISEGACPYTITRTWVATDACGNETVASQVITVSDTQAPVFETHPAQITVPCDEADQVTLIATDNCSQEVEVTSTDQIFSGSCYGTIERTFTATDACGNSAVTVMYIFQTDEIAPEFSNTPGDLQVDCGDPIPAVQTPTAIDNCDNELTVTFTETQSGTDCPYVITRSWTAVDDCGNVGFYNQLITVVTNVDTDNIITNAYPNPFENEFTMTFVVPEDGFVVYEVFNSMGQTVETVFKGYALGGIEYQFNISTDSWSDGTYTSRIIMDSEVETNKIVKSK